MIIGDRGASGNKGCRQKRTLENSAVIVLALLLAISISGNLKWLANSFENKSHQEQERRNASDKFCGVSYDPQCHGVRQTIAAERSADNAGIQNGIGLLGFLFVVAATLAAVQAARHTKRQADIASHALAIGNRAWLSPKVTLSAPLTFSSTGVEVGIDVRIANIGTIPAVEARIDVRLVPDGTQTVLEEMREFWRARPFRPMGSTIFPGQTFPEHEFLRVTHGLTLNPEQILKGKILLCDREVIMLCIVGCIAYTFSTDPNVHFTTFIYELSADADGRYLTVGQDYTVDQLQISGDLLGMGVRAD